MLLYGLGNSIPFKPASFIIWSAILKNTWVFLGCETKKRPRQNSREVKFYTSKPSHPTEDPRCHQPDIVVRIHNVEGGRRSPPQFFCAREFWRGFVLVVKCGEITLRISVYMYALYTYYIYICKYISYICIYLYLLYIT